MNKKRKYLFFRSVAAFLLAVLLLVSYETTVYAAEDTNKSVIKITEADHSTLLPFAVENMFPGDAVTKDVTVNVSHKEAITLYYHADIHSGYEKLSEVLKIKVELPDKGIELYDGLMSDMPSSLPQQLSASERSLTYRLTVYLDHSVGTINEVDTDGKRYMFQSLKADFRWWFMEEAEPEEPTGPHVAKVKLTAEKVLDGEFARGSEFTFELKDAEGNIIQRVKNEDGHIAFDTMDFYNTGTFIYYITEQAGSKKGATYDDTVYTAIVLVVEDEDDYAAYVTYQKDGEAYEGVPRFHNWSGKVPIISDPSEPTTPVTGDDSNIVLYVVLAAVSLLILIVLPFTKSRKGEQQNG